MSAASVMTGSQKPVPPHAQARGGRHDLILAKGVLPMPRRVAAATRGFAFSRVMFALAASDCYIRIGAGNTRTGYARNRLRRMERGGQDDAHCPAHSGIESPRLPRLERTKQTPPNLPLPPTPSR